MPSRRNTYQRVEQDESSSLWEAGDPVQGIAGTTDWTQMQPMANRSQESIAPPSSESSSAESRRGQPGEGVDDPPLMLARSASRSIESNRGLTGRPPSDTFDHPLGGPVHPERKSEDGSQHQNQPARPSLRFSPSAAPIDGPRSASSVGGGSMAGPWHISTPVSPGDGMHTGPASGQSSHVLYHETFVPPGSAISAATSSIMARTDSQATTQSTSSPLAVRALRPDTPASGITDQTGSSDYTTRGAELLDMKPKVPGLSKTGTFWEVCHDHQRILDRQTIQEWREELDNLTIIIGLFSATVTAFLVMDANPDPSDATAQLLVRYIDYTAHFPLNPPLSVMDQESLYNTFADTPPVSALRIATVTLWSLSVLVLFVALVFAFYIKSWIQHYRKDMQTGSNYDRAHLRQQRHDDFQAWNVPALISTVPLLVHLAVLLFIAGMLGKLFAFHFIPAIVATVFSGCATVLYLSMTIWPLLREDCPYHNSMVRLFVGFGGWAQGKLSVALAILSQMAGWAWRMIVRIFEGNHLSLSGASSAPNVTQPLPTGSMQISWSKPNPLAAVPPVHRNLALVQEKKRVDAHTEDLDWHAVTWMLDQFPQSVVCQQAFAHLKYVPGKVIRILDTSIPSGLVTRFQMPVLEEEFWVKPPQPLQANSALRKYLSFVHDAIQAHRRMWEFLALDECTLSPSGSDWYHPTTEHLTPDLMRLWKLIGTTRWSVDPNALSGRTFPVYERLKDMGWAEDEVEECFASSLVTEAIYYHLKLAHRHGLQEAEIKRENPLNDLLQWIRLRIRLSSHQESSGVATSAQLAPSASLRAVAVALSGIALCLLQTEPAVVFSHRNSVLTCLFDLVVALRPKQTIMVPALTACLAMFATNDQFERKKAAVIAANFDIPHKPHDLFLKEYSKLLDVIVKVTIRYHEDNKDDLANTTALVLFRTYVGALPRSCPPASLFQALPGCCVDYVVAESCHVEQHMLPLAHLIASAGWYECNRISDHTKHSAIALGQEILRMPLEIRSQNPWSTVTSDTLALFKRLLAESVDWQTRDICEALASVFEHDMTSTVGTMVIVDALRLGLHEDIAGALRASSNHGFFLGNWAVVLDTWERRGHQGDGLELRAQETLRGALEEAGRNA